MYLMAILLISSVIARADETITVSATNSDIAASLDLKVVAKIFGEAKDLEDFEQRLNNPDSAFVNLDLNGDGDVDYIRVIETTNGNKHLIVLQAVLAKDIYQDVASIYVEKDEATNNVSVQVIGDEYIYGENYVIEPVYIYRPVIYDWFWSPYWVCWSSPWYWGYYPYWWHPWGCVHYWAYWDHCYRFHHHHHGCSFRYATSARPASRTMREGVSRTDYAKANPDRSFRSRNEGLTNARQLPVATRTNATRAAVGNDIQTRMNTSTTARPASDRVYGSTFTRSASVTTRKPASEVTTTRTTTATTARPAPSVTTTRSTTTTTNRPAPTVTTTRSTTTTSRPAPAVTTRSTTTTTSRPAPTTTTSRPASTTTSRPAPTTTTSRPSGSYSGGGSSRPSGGFSGGSSSGSSAPSMPRGGGGSSTRR